MTEFELIRHFFAPLGADGDGGVEVGIGDDCALLAPSRGARMVWTTDTLVEGRHFAKGAGPIDLGWKSLAVNLSDLAAMGARPRWYSMALTLPRIDASWLQGFVTGLAEAMRAYDIALAGGDTTGGPLSITISAIGELPEGRGLFRSGARPGDIVCVTGTLGDAACGLALSRAEHCGTAIDDRRSLSARLQRPTPRVEVGLALRDIATAAIDVSDGLAADLGHILKASDVGACVDVERLPLSEAMIRVAGDPALARDYAMTGGDDYELCLCIPSERLSEAQSQCLSLGVALTDIGEITSTEGLLTRLQDGQTIELQRRGYDHFG